MSNLSYEITSWDQITKCRSNTSNNLSCVVRYLSSDDISGKLIQVEHTHLGCIYSTIITPIGSAIDNDNVITQSASDILKTLAMYGFDIRFVDGHTLTTAERAGLIGVKRLGFTHVRNIVVTERNATRIKTVAFLNNPVWVTASCVSISSELFTSYQTIGSLVDLSVLLPRVDWSWITISYPLSSITEE